MIEMLIQIPESRFLIYFMGLSIICIIFALYLKESENYLAGMITLIMGFIITAIGLTKICFDLEQRRSTGYLFLHLIVTLIALFIVSGKIRLGGRGSGGSYSADGGSSYGAGCGGGCGGGGSSGCGDGGGGCGGGCGGCGGGGCGG